MTPSDALISECSNRLHAALAKYEVEGLWPKKRIAFLRTHPDEFGAEISAHYDATHAELCRETSTAVLTAVMDLARASGVRFASLDQKDFICFENITAAHYSSYTKPVSWAVAEQLDRHQKDHKHHSHSRFDTGCGNGPQRQVSLVRIMDDGCWGKPALLPSDCGIYDLRDGGLTRICAPISLMEMRRVEVHAKYQNGTDLLAYMARAGADVPVYTTLTQGA
jgi:hypothetical protein